jgi:uncharacterized protein (TIGR04255 family)
MSAESLPSYERPPVQEVALGLRFDSLDLQLPHFVEFWTSLRDRFPNLEQAPALPPTPAEDLSATTPDGPQLQLLMGQGSPLPRFWLVSEEGNEVCQIQGDRLIVNWRSRDDADVYPRYEYVKELLVSCLDALLLLISASGLGELKVFQVEVDYVNQIDQGQGWTDLSDLGHVFSGWDPTPAQSELPVPTRAGMEIQYLIPDSADPDGRLYVNITSATRDKRPVMNLVLRARMPVPERTIEAALNALDVGRSWIVHTFTSLTTPEMHEIWGRER